MGEQKEMEDAFEVCAMRVLAANDSGVLSAPTGDDDHDAQNQSNGKRSGALTAKAAMRKSPMATGEALVQSPMAMHRRRRRRRKRTRPVSLEKLRVDHSGDEQLVYVRQNDSVRQNLSSKLKDKVWQTPKRSPPTKRRKITKEPEPVMRSDCVVGNNEVEDDTDDVPMAGLEKESENEEESKTEIMGSEPVRQPTEVIDSDGEAVTQEEQGGNPKKQCSQCGEYGHFSRNCPFTQREIEKEEDDIDGDDNGDESESEAVNDGGSSGEDSYAPEKEIEKTTSDRRLRSATEDEIVKGGANEDGASSGDNESSSEDEDI